MTRALVVSRSAEIDISHGYAWYEARESLLGERFLSEVELVFGRILEHPLSNTEVLPGVRRAVTRVYPYLVFYTWDDERVAVIAVVPAAQDPDYIRSRIQS